MISRLAAIPPLSIWSSRSSFGIVAMARPMVTSTQNEFVVPIDCLSFGEACATIASRAMKHARTVSEDLLAYCSGIMGEGSTCDIGRSGWMAVCRFSPVLDQCQNYAAYSVTEISAGGCEFVKRQHHVEELEGMIVRWLKDNG